MCLTGQARVIAKKHMHLVMPELFIRVEKASSFAHFFFNLRIFYKRICSVINVVPC